MIAFTKMLERKKKLKNKIFFLSSVFGRRWKSGKIKIKLLLYPVCSLKQWDNDGNFISLSLWQFSLSLIPKFEKNLNGEAKLKIPTDPI